LRRKHKIKKKKKRKQKPNEKVKSIKYTPKM
jgi:hypothetical protein